MYEDRSPSGKPCRQLTEGFRSGWILGEKLTGSSGEPTKKGYFPKDYCVSHAESGALAVAGLFWPPVWNEELHFELASATGQREPALDRLLFDSVSWRCCLSSELERYLAMLGEMNDGVVAPPAEAESDATANFAPVHVLSAL